MHGPKNKKVIWCLVDIDVGNVKTGVSDLKKTQFAIK